MFVYKIYNLLLFVCFVTLFACYVKLVAVYVVYSLGAGAEVGLRQFLRSPLSTQTVLRKGEVMNFGYCRVSTVGQSLDTQLKQLSFCDRLFQEKVSGASMGRPQLDHLISIMRNGDVLNVTKLDRLARSTKDLLEIVEDLKKRGCTLKILNINLDTSTPTGKLMLTMLGAIATFERELMLERQREGIVRAKAKGKYKGRKAMEPERQAQLLTHLRNGVSRPDTAVLMGVSIATVHRTAQKAKRESRKGDC